MGNTTATSVSAIEKVVARLRWRLRAQAALRHGLLLGAIGLFAFALCVLLVKLRVLPTDWVWVGGGIAIALPLIGIGLGVFKRMGDIQLAAALDAAGGLHSRLGSALAFARLPERTAMQEAAVEDAVHVIAQARPAGAAPWRWGAFAAGAIALAIAFAITGPAVFVFELRVADMSGQSLGRIVLPERVQLAKAEIRKEDGKRLEDLAEDLTEEAKAATDPVIKQFLDELNELIRALQEGRITPEEAAARMAALEKALEDWKQDNQQGAEAVEKRLQEAAEKQKKAHDALKPLLDAMRERDWDKAADKLDELAKKLEKKELPKKDQEKIAKDLEQLAKALENERQKDKERLEKERDRLKEKAGARERPLRQEGPRSPGGHAAPARAARRPAAAPGPIRPRAPARAPLGRPRRRRARHVAAPRRGAAPSPARARRTRRTRRRVGAAAPTRRRARRPG